MDLGKLGEFGFIKRLSSRLPPAPPSLRTGIGDDASVWSPTPGCDILSTCDLLIESVHFDLKTTGPWQLGAKALCASLSDIAAMGGMPKVFLVSLSVPRRRGLDSRFFESFYDGMQAWAGSYGATLAGGDTTSSPGPLVVDIFMNGECEKGRALLRSGVRPGDLCFATGTLGDSAAGLACLGLNKGDRRVPAGPRTLLEKRHLLPQPQYLAGRWLLKHRAASACIDLSDGLSSEVNHLAEESGVGFELDTAALPLSRPLLAAAQGLKADPLKWGLHGGEDYQLLFTVPPSRLKLVMDRMSRETGAKVSLLGRAVRKSAGVKIFKGRRKSLLKPGGYKHFS